jgi:hypothetical protein
MGKYHKIEKMLDEELDKISAQGKLGTSSLEVGDKVAHFLKSIKTIEAMEEADEGSSYDYPMMMDGGRSYNYDGMSYARGDGRGRGSNARRDSRGRYSSRYDGNSMNSGKKEDLMQEIEMLKEQIENMED